MCMCLHIYIHQILSSPIFQREGAAIQHCVWLGLWNSSYFSSLSNVALLQFLSHPWNMTVKRVGLIFDLLTPYVRFSDYIFSNYLSFIVSVKVFIRFFHSSYLMCLIWHKPQAAHAGLVEKSPCLRPLKDDFKLHSVLAGNLGIEVSGLVRTACTKCHISIPENSACIWPHSFGWLLIELICVLFELLFFRFDPGGADFLNNRNRSVLMIKQDVV